MNKIKFYKRLLVEIVETLATICLYLGEQGMRNHSMYTYHVSGHFHELAKMSVELRGKVK